MSKIGVPDDKFWTPPWMSKIGPPPGPKIWTPPDVENRGWTSDPRFWVPGPIFWDLGPDPIFGDLRTWVVPTIPTSGFSCREWHPGRRSPFSCRCHNRLDMSRAGLPDPIVHCCVKRPDPWWHDRTTGFNFLRHETPMLLQSCRHVCDYLFLGCNLYEKCRLEIEVQVKGLIWAVRPKKEKNRRSERRLEFNFTSIIISKC